MHQASLGESSRPEPRIAPLIVDVGCGSNKVADAVGVDRLRLPNVDFVCDFECEPLPFATSSVDVIHTRHTLEHIVNVNAFLRELLRVLKPGGRLYVTVPHFSSTLAYSDPTHVRTIGYYWFSYFSRRQERYWTVPRYTEDIWFNIEDRRFSFRNWSIFGPLLDRVFNASPLLQHVYESKVSWTLPCFELHFELSPDKSD